jgi:predicted Rossmann fold nucleotide-binding protein DprA/Smf involved in DNA uptake
MTDRLEKGEVMMREPSFRDSRRAVPARERNSAGRLVHLVGNTVILDRPMVALLCSAKCPGKLILDTYDLAKRFRERGVTVISGFHSAMEEECLRILLRSPHPVVWCLARGIFKRVPTKPVDCRAAVTEGRLLIVSPFKDSVRRVTAKMAIVRNRIVADLAAAVVVAHAAPGSKIEALALELLAAGKPLYTFNHPANAAILNRGAKDVGDLNFDMFASD